MAVVEPQLPELSVREQDCLAELQRTYGREHTQFELVKFVIALKGDYDRCVERLHNYRRELLPRFRPEAVRARHVRSLLQRQVLQLPGSRDRDGATVIVYNAHRHVKTTSDEQREEALKAVIYLIELATYQQGTLRNGIALVANLTSVGMSQLDGPMHQFVLSVLQNAYPARLKHVYVINPNLWVHALITVSRPFMKRKLAERVVVVPSYDRLQEHIHPDELITQFGGRRTFDPVAWLESITVRRNRVHQLPSAPL
ncbi:uncharacterized protein MONBRDRAFT_9913 [Monosiga brevicollis MX1]|uniref:CRAL-TRIO domain-containing protein n=1 Tax=Monosiga brevicollis TaxID=81824 RepID=A9V4M2_MONBE|nr:uncharacterized protein MONBRDRAFT_9913 [Monosiga brevicollis MX1]EDQ87478.1 predicted protein [Monosiga brevicollis MX1]|eukprot:XP_001747738.1 hypothetical protein [Monosiga brevicollis MX1]